MVFSVPLHPQWHRTATGTGCCPVVVLMEHLSRSILGYFQGYGSDGEKAEIWEAARRRIRPRLRRLLQPLAPALENAVSSASLQLFSLLPLSLPQPLSSCAENVFVLPFVITSGCWRREGGWYFVFSSSRSSALIDTCQVWTVAETLWAECINVCRVKKRAGWFCFNNKIKVPLKFTHGPRNKHDKLQPRG